MHCQHLVITCGNLAWSGDRWEEVVGLSFNVTGVLKSHLQAFLYALIFINDAIGLY